MPSRNHLEFCCGQVLNLLQAYEALKASDPNFYRETDDLAYGSAPKPSEAAVERLVEDLINQKRKKGEFSRRRYPPPPPHLQLESLQADLICMHS